MQDISADRVSRRSIEAQRPLDSLRLMRRFSLTYRGRIIPVAPRTQRVLAFLGLHDCVNRSHLGGELWPEATEAKALASLRTALWRIQRVADGLVLVEGDLLSLAPTVQVDVPRLVAAARRMLSTGSDCDYPADHSEVLRWGELLPGWYEDWVLMEREQIRQLQMHMLEALADRLTDRGRHAEAIDAALEAVRLEPLRGSAHRAVVRAYLAEGNVNEAMQHFVKFRALLRAELGVEPSIELTELITAATVPSATRWIRAPRVGHLRRPWTAAASG